MSEKKLSGLVASSSNPDEISNRVRGLVLGLSSVIIYIATNLFGVNISVNDVVDLASASGVIAGAIWLIYGSGLSLINKFARV